MSEPPHRQQLLGSWKLVSWTIEYPDRDPVYPYGEQAEGLLVYSVDGYMSACIGMPGRPPLGSESTRMARPEEKERAFDSYFQYAGTWELDGDCVLHHVLHALNPGFPGSTQRRTLRFEHGDLLLGAVEDLSGGRQRRHLLRWRRP